MNKKAAIILAAVIGVLVLGGGVYAYTSNQAAQDEADKMAMEKKENEAMNDDSMEKDNAKKESDAMVKDDNMEKTDAMAKSGSYITLADYKANKSKYAGTKNVYFFHASWCSICQGIEKEINADTSKIPAGVTLIKTDYDSSTELRQKYGVTTQYTFVQFKTNGDKIAKWSATNLDAALDGIES